MAENEHLCYLGCGRPVHSRRMCRVHYQRWYRGHDLNTPLPPLEIKLCRIKDCTRPAVSRGLCKMHYDRWYRGRQLDMEYQKPIRVYTQQKPTAPPKVQQAEAKQDKYGNRAAWIRFIQEQFPL